MSAVAELSRERFVHEQVNTFGEALQVRCFHRVAADDDRSTLVVETWRRLDGAHLLPLVRAGIVFVDGVQRTTSGRRSNAHAA